MDIREEKIAHEKHLLSQGVDFKYLPNIQYNELENIYELIEWDEEYSKALNEINSSWCTWQAAKAQAIPEGFVVVPKEPTQELLNKMQDFFVGAFENGLTGGQSIHCAYIAMIEAQEQSTGAKP
ncbi:hypothetical protein LZP46_07800 [Acinetobacter sp. SCLZS86]|uniref:hypothetical protein n=1 Tax=Acinetobacter sp. SCLZS86 TaxID=2908637 RepID=UPI001F2824CE|nr:hypothetical protein [Acinetobacter sp. SCLZS86]UIZ56333.1 hypothetical protein LZP46_07800 [Acinetobacter sp. SCLZS86]